MNHRVRHVEARGSGRMASVIQDMVRCNVTSAAHAVSDSVTTQTRMFY